MNRMSSPPSTLPRCPSDAAFPSPSPAEPIRARAEERNAYRSSKQKLQRCSPRRSSESAEREHVVQKSKQSWEAREVWEMVKERRGELCGTRKPDEIDPRPRRGTEPLSRDCTPGFTGRSRLCYIALLAPTLGDQKIYLIHYKQPGRVDLASNVHFGFASAFVSGAERLLTFPCCPKQRHKEACSIGFCTDTKSHRVRPVR